ncbi:PQQ-like beta-propeller repeat protein [Saccharopolyspora gloriosae]|uniref:PQQ-like beta-propeller repeat protein n=1 Tax=Saccharopolyspora gloriosae TaxID=455344 RepID=UPI001FB7A892|nr:PQQ-like beta-propeller repeat protein [Saccharopolyspora gloriosae]
MRSAVRSTLSAAVGTALAFSGTVAIPAAAAPAAITCDSHAGGDSGFYNGDSAGKVYNGKFGQGPGIPGLGSYVPQGLTTWNDWDGGKDLLLITEYGPDGKHARIYGVDPATGERVGTVAIAESHVGGIAVARGWVFVSGRQAGDGGHTIRKYKATDVAKALKADNGEVLAQTGEARKVYGSSFLTSDGNTLYSGKFNDSGRDSMYAYAVAADGTLTTGTKYEVPTKTQGLSVADGHFFYSTSYGRQNRSNIYVVDKGATDIDKASTKCFRAPSMAEGITDHDGTTYLLFESGADTYAQTGCSEGDFDPCTRNVIQNLHTASTASLPKF